MWKCTSQLELPHRCAVRQSQAHMYRDLQLSDLRLETRDMGQLTGFFAKAF